MTVQLLGGILIGIIGTIVFGVCLLIFWEDNHDKR
jgi:hypothetical protein